MNVVATYKKFKVNQYEGTELESLGNQIVQHILNHIGMIRYTKTNVKYFDFTPGELGQLTEKASIVLTGVSVHKGLAEYRRVVNDLVIYIQEMQTEKNRKDSVKESLRKSVAMELKRFMNENIDFEHLWEI